MKEFIVWDDVVDVIHFFDNMDMVNDYVSAKAEDFTRSYNNKPFDFSTIFVFKKININWEVEVVEKEIENLEAQIDVLRVKLYDMEKKKFNLVSGGIKVGTGITM